MILLRRFVLLGLILAVQSLAAQTPAPPNQTDAPAISPASERDARLVERYQAMLAANPVEGLALERLWKSAQEQGTTALLLDEYRRAAEAPSPQAPAILVYGHLLQRAGRLDAAEAAFARAAAIDPTNLLPPLALGDLATARAQPAAAAGFFTEAAGKLPASDRRRTDILLKLGSAWMSGKDPAKAAEAWEKIVAANPADIALHRRLAENYEKNRLPERAIAHYEYIEQHAEPEQRALAWRELARLHEARGEIDAAGAALEQGLTLTARDNWLHSELEHNLIRLYQRAGRVPELAARWQAEVTKAPRDLGGYLRLQKLAAAQGDPEAERTWLERIVALAPNDREDTLKLAQLLADAGERDRAAALYDTVLKEHPADLDLIFTRAELDLQLGHPQAAVDRIEAFVARAPADESVTTPALQFFLSHHLDVAAEHRLQADAARQPRAEDPALALAKFYFSQRRTAEARAVLENLANLPGEPAAKAARLLRVAECDKDEHQIDDALRLWHRAADLNPVAAAPWLAASDALATQGQTGAARDALEHALSITAPGPERVETDHKLFGLLESEDQGSGAQAKFAPDPAALPATDPALLAGGHRVTHYIAALETAATSAPSPDAYLRLARWQAWHHETDDAAAAADKVITLDPGNIPARKLLVSLAQETHQRDIAEQRLGEISKLDPAQSATCRRQIAELKTEDGNFDEAVALFSSLQQDAPGSVAALTDLALAQQRAERWYDALTTWERAYALPSATPAERNDVRRPMLLVLERLGQFPRGAEILQAAVDAQTDLAARQELFQELAGFCQRHDLTGWLRQQYDARLAAQPTDYFTLTALATLQKAAGHLREAYQLLRQADFSAPDPVRSLQALIAAAGALGETGDAVSWQRRLLAVPGQDTADNLERLAELEAEGFATEEAGRAWDRAVARYPRQSDVLDKAAEFFERKGRLARARDLLGQAAAVEPNGLKRLLHLGQLDLATQQVPQARECFEEILARSEPEKVGSAFLPPAELKAQPEKVSAGFAAAVARFRARYAATASEAAATVPAPAPEDERQVRLAAIRRLSELLFAQPSGDKLKPALGGTEKDRQQWLARWQAAAAAGVMSEPFWAFYYSREQTLMMDALSGWMTRAPADAALRETFTSAGLRVGAYRALAHWAWDAPNAEHVAANGQVLVNALIEYLATGGKPGPEIVGELFPPRAAGRDLLWKAAEEGFAAEEWYAPAAELGERAVALSSSSRANFVLPVAQWELYLGQVERARAVLRSALTQGGGDSFESGTSPVFTVLREYFLLLPEKERAGFVDEYLRPAASAGAGPVHAVLAAALLHGLSGDWKTADGDLDQLLALRLLASDAGGGSPDVRRWSYLRDTGLQLLEWNLEPLAAYLWQRGLSQANAFERQDNETLAVRWEIRARLLGLQVTLAPDPARGRQYVEDYLREDPPPGNVAQLAGQLRESAQPRASMLANAYLCQQEPSNPEYWRSLFAAYEAAGEHAAYDQTLTMLLDGTQPLPASLTRTELLARAAKVRQEEGDGEGGRRLLERALLKAPRSVPLLEQLAGSYVLAGQPEKAADVWRQALPYDLEGHAALALAALEEAGKHRDDAINVLEQAHRRYPDDFELTVQLGRQDAAAGRVDSLRTLATESAKTGNLNILTALASSIDDPAACRTLRDILADTVRQAHEPQERFRAQLGVVSLYRTRANDDAAFELDLQRLERLAGTMPAWRDQFMQERFDVARKRGADAWLQGELAREWQAGQGDPVAGAMLVRLLLPTEQGQAGQDLRKVVAEIDARPNLPELTLYDIAQELGQSKDASLALPIAQRLTVRFPDKEAYTLERARVCWQAGRREEARTLLEALDATSVTVMNTADRIGDLYATLGDRAGAREFYARAVARDPWGLRSLPAYLHLAQADIEDKRFADARRLLLTAYRNPACADLSPLVAYLSATGRFSPDAANRLPGAEFPLSFAGRGRLLTELCAMLGQTQPDQARQLAMAHPELWSEAPAVVESLCFRTSPSEWPALAAALEDAVLQANPPSRLLQHSLGDLYARWALAESKENGHGAEALAHLVRAHDLQPDNFGLARQLAEVYLAKKQASRAAVVLRDFLSADAFPAERQQAQQILARK